MWLKLKMLRSNVLADRLRLLFSHPDELQMDKRDSDGLFSTKLVGRPVLSLITLNPQVLLSFPHAKLALC